MADHEHDWRRNPQSSHYRLDGAGRYLKPVRCAICPAKAWTVQSDEVELWPPYRGPVCEIEEPTII